MTVLRAAAIALVLLLTLVLGAPLQVALARVRPHAAAWIPRLFCRVMLALLGVRIDADLITAPAAARLVVANHVSWLDILVFGSLEPLCFLAKSDVAEWPGFGTLARVSGTVFVDRTRRRSIPGANRAMAARLASGRSVLLFPEGTTHDGTRRGRFHTSHLACLRDLMADGHHPARVQAVALGYSNGDAAWIGDATLLPHIWTVLRCRRLVCRVHVGAVTDVEPGFDRKVLGRALAGEVEELLAAEEPTRAGAFAPTGPLAPAPISPLSGAASSTVQA